MFLNFSISFSSSSVFVFVLLILTQRIILLSLNNCVNIDHSAQGSVAAMRKRKKITNSETKARFHIKICFLSEIICVLTAWMCVNRFANKIQRLYSFVWTRKLMMPLNLFQPQYLCSNWTHRVNFQFPAVENGKWFSQSHVGKADELFERKRVEKLWMENWILHHQGIELNDDSEWNSM